MNNVLRFSSVLLLSFSLGGCATVAGLGLGAAVGLAVATGAGSAVGDVAVHAGVNKYRAWKVCHRIKDPIEKWKCNDNVKAKLEGM